MAWLGLSDQGLLIDPWNGAGTTTTVALQRGVPCWGGDINPAMAVIAKARLLGSHVSPNDALLCEKLLGEARDLVIPNDPLHTWLADSGAAAVRGIERSIALFMDTNVGLDDIEARVSNLSPLAAFFYLVLFQAVRKLFSTIRL